MTNHKAMAILKKVFGDPAKQPEKKKQKQKLNIPLLSITLLLFLVVVGLIIRRLNTGVNSVQLLKK